MQRPFGCTSAPRAHSMRMSPFALALALSAPFGARASDVVYAFTGNADGGRPIAGLIKDGAGNLYGTTTTGGTYGAGTVFMLTPAGAETVLHSFGGSGDGEAPGAGLIEDSSGNFYGTTEYGGTYEKGTVFELAANGTESVLYAFTGGNDGGFPVAGLTMDKSGDLFGTASYGGAEGNGYYGTLFELPPDGILKVLHSFTSGTDGADPLASLLMDKAGNLYGTTYSGGAQGDGTAFKVTPKGVETLLYNFCAQPKCSDGANPAAGLIRDKAGNFYGTTSGGGGIDGYGTVFELPAAGGETVLHPFAAGGDGNFPNSGLIMDTASNLYGTTYKGGTDNFGTVFELAAAGGEKVLHSFVAAPDGAYCLAGLLLSSSNYLYGTTLQGGASNAGIVFKIQK